MRIEKLFRKKKQKHLFIRFFILSMTQAISVESTRNVHCSQSSEGMIFRCKKGDKRMAAGEMHSILDSIIESLSAIANFGEDGEEDIPNVRFSDHSIAIETDNEHIVAFYCDREPPRWPSMTDAAKLLLDFHFMAQAPAPEYVRALVPFNSCCTAHIDSIKETMHAFIGGSITSLRKRGAASNMMHPYDFAVEVHANGSIEAAKEEISENLTHELEQFDDILVFDKNFERTLADPDRINTITVLFQVTVLEDNAYFSVMHGPHLVNGYRYSNDAVV